jgi:hypothetical protein
MRARADLPRAGRTLRPRHWLRHLASMLDQARALVPDASVDVVMTFTVFQHIPDIGVIERYIAEADRCFSPQGDFVFEWKQHSRAPALAAAWRGPGDPSAHRSAAGALPPQRGPVHRQRPVAESDARHARRRGALLCRDQGDDPLFCWGWAWRALRYATTLRSDEQPPGSNASLSERC